MVWLGGTYTHGHPGANTSVQPLAQPKGRSGTQGMLAGGGKGERCELGMLKKAVHEGIEWKSV